MDADRATLRIVTQNLLAPDQADWERRLPVIRAALRAVDPDVVAFQEITWGQGVDVVEQLLGPGYETARHSGRSADGVGAVLASRLPFGTIRELDLHVPPRAPRNGPFPWNAVVAAEVLTPLGTVLFAHHKPTYERHLAYERELQTVAAARFVEELVDGTDHHGVVLGDLDDTPDSSGLRFWTGRQSLHGCSVAYEDAWAAVHPDDPGLTFSPANPLVASGEIPQERGRRIDYVLVRAPLMNPTLEPVSVTRLLTDPVDGVWGSDHFGLAVELRRPPREPRPPRQPEHRTA